MSVQHKKNFTKLDNQDHILVKKGLPVVARRFLETRKVRLRDGKVFFLFIRVLFFSKNVTCFVIDPFLLQANAQVFLQTFGPQEIKNNTITMARDVIFVFITMARDVFIIDFEQAITNKKNVLSNSFVEWKLQMVSLILRYF